MIEFLVAISYSEERVVVDHSESSHLSFVIYCIIRFMHYFAKDCKIITGKQFGNTT
jgi:hypothetical protein